MLLGEVLNVTVADSIEIFDATSDRTILKISHDFDAVAIFSNSFKHCKVCGLSAENDVFKISIDTSD